MDEHRGSSPNGPTASPWPPFVALGLPVAEAGVLFGVFPVAVAGLLLFVGSVAGLLHEAGYVDSPWRAVAGIGLLLAPVGTWLAYGGPGFPGRGQAVLVAAAIVIVGGVAGEVLGLGTRAPVG